MLEHIHHIQKKTNINIIGYVCLKKYTNTMQIMLLPDELISTIFEYIPLFYRLRLNKYYYEKYHSYLRRSYSTHCLKCIINCDYDYVFAQVIRENMIKWLKPTLFRYTNMEFNNYIYFVLHYCNANNASKCRLIVIDYLKQRDLYRNLHKKNVSKYIK